MQKSVRIVLVFTLALLIAKPLFSQIESTDRRDIRRVGSLESYFSSYGSERAWDGVANYRGLDWPAQYDRQDNAVIKRFWIGTKDFTDEFNWPWGSYVMYMAADYVGQTIFPVVLKQTARFETPVVIVDGNNITAPYTVDVDSLDPGQIADRIIVNTVNTTMGLTLTRRIHVFSQQYHDNYYIKEFIFTNTGNTDYDDEIELTSTLKDVRMAWGTRYSVCWDGAFVIGGSQKWGKFSWVTRRGENYAEHYADPITLANPIVDWIRCGFQWAGQADDKAFDVIGAPDYTKDGRLRAPQHAGVAILHVDKSPADATDDINQPVILGWHAGDTYPKVGDMSHGQEPQMNSIYNSILSGIPYIQGGDERFDEKYMKTNPSPWTVHNDGGGTNLYVAYGPYTLEHGQSVRIVEAEGVSGLSRTMCEQIGRRWKLAYDDPADKGPFYLPDGTTTDDKDEYKNEWIYTGKDSIMLTFSRAKRNFDSGYQIPQPPMPPSLFEVKSGGDRIVLRWSPSPSESDPDFGGYKIYRAIGKPDTTHYEIFTGDKGIYEYSDTDATRGFSYYYYIVAFSNGNSNNTDLNPHGPLYSSSFYTRTTEPAYLRRPAESSLNTVRIVPNPYYIRAKSLQFLEEPDKIMFYNLPKSCVIKIYTERGDLIKTINHIDGSGDEAWNSVTDSRQVVVSGIYIAYIEVDKDIYNDETGELQLKKGESVTKKLIVIR